MKLLQTILSFIKPQAVYSVNSPINGEIAVVQTMGRYELVVGDLQQSGWLVGKIWNTAFGSNKRATRPIGKVLVLGLGGGSIVKYVNKYFPNAAVTAVEIDRHVIDIGKKYFDLNSYSKLSIRVADAFKIVEKEKKNSYDIIAVDLYVGEDIPKKIYTIKFLTQLRRLVSDSGVVFINHLRGGPLEERLQNLEQRLSRVFGSVESITPLVNTVFVCRP